MTYATWMAEVDKILDGLIGLSQSDLADWNSRIAYDEGLSPREAARECLEAQDGFPEELMEGLTDD